MLVSTCFGDRLLENDVFPVAPAELRLILKFDFMLFIIDLFIPLTFQSSEKLCILASRFRNFTILFAIDAEIPASEDNFREEQAFKSAIFVSSADITSELVTSIKRCDIPD